MEEYDIQRNLILLCWKLAHGHRIYGTRPGDVSIDLTACLIITEERFIFVIGSV